MHTQSTFSFENLDAYQLALSTNKRVADSVVLNLAEGCGRGRKTAAGRNHFRIALGSAGEVFAVFQMLELDEELQSDLRRVGAMLAGLAR